MLSLVTVPMSLSASVNLQVDIPWDFEQIEADSKLLAQHKNILDLEWNDPASPASYATFVLVNLADVHSTHKAMQFSCLEEGNPLLPKRPHLDRLLAHKVVVLYPTIHPKFNRYVLTDEDFFWPNVFIAAISYNNYRLIRKAKKYEGRGECPRV